MRIRSDPRYNSLLEEFWKAGSPVQQLLSLPRERLHPRASAILNTPIPRVFDFRLPYFPFAEPVSYELLVEHDGLAKVPADMQTEVDDSTEEEEEDPFEFMSDKEIRRTVIRNNPALLRCVTSPDYDWNMMLRETKDLSEVNLDFLQSTDFFERLQESAPLKITPEDKDVDKLLKRVARHLMEPFRRDPLFLLRFFGEKLDRLGSIQEFLRDKLPAYLRFLGLSYDVYRDALQQLAKRDLLVSYGGVLACRVCEEADSRSTLFSFSKLPTDALRTDCPRCGETMEAAILYGIDDLLYDLIAFSDGFLTVALAWLFENDHLDWRYSIPTPGSECDFVIRKQGVAAAIEVKMLDSRSSLASSRISEGVRQAVDAAKYLDTTEAWLIFQGPRTKSPDGSLDQTPQKSSGVSLVEFGRVPQLLESFGLGARPSRRR